jgi:hypothetical protein
MKVILPLFIPMNIGRLKIDEAKLSAIGKSPFLCPKYP